MTLPANIQTALTVSTRAPVKGATFAYLFWGCVCRRFNSRSREGSDGLYKIPSPVFLCFNSRSREGSDMWRTPTYFFNWLVSTRAPVKGATDPFESAVEIKIVSTRAPVKGATATLLAIEAPFLPFQLALP